MSVGNAGDRSRTGGKVGTGAAALRPRLGVLFATSDWFRDVGLRGADPDTTRDVAGAALVAAIEEFATPVCNGESLAGPAKTEGDSHLSVAIDRPPERVRST